MKHLLLLPALLLAGCTLTGPGTVTELTDLQQARARWQSSASADYDMQLFRGCFCAGSGELHIFVRDDSLAAIKQQEDYWVVDETWWQYIPTVDELFDLIEEATREADELTVTYHPELGYPTEISIDWLADAVDDEIMYQVRSVDLTPATDVFRLDFGEAAQAAAGVRLVFSEIVEDSRCPINADCIWEGRIVVNVSAISGNVVDELRLVRRGNLDGDSPTGSAFGVTVTMISASPYPGSVPSPIPDEDYWIYLVVEPTNS
ncbi:MAG: hypothetical protein JJ896_11210 [Rhodothermales bacterium]|nr:hypothetical protein [Rhodothermales bacterium]MBO6780210.1 hypothetical protein [Rhodothermales bacterium]